ncbi:hypothetical protein MRB53_039289 [Persea americana]|nr:hypothetical protein MRB53_039289 [Persea americana]
MTALFDSNTWYHISNQGIGLATSYLAASCAPVQFGVCYMNLTTDATNYTAMTTGVPDYMQWQVINVGSYDSYYFRNRAGYIVGFAHTFVEGADDIYDEQEVTDAQIRPEVGNNSIWHIEAWPNDYSFYIWNQANGSAYHLDVRTDPNQSNVNSSLYMTWNTTKSFDRQWVLNPISKINDTLWSTVRIQPMILMQH